MRRVLQMSESGEAGGRQERHVLSFFRVILTRLNTSKKWGVVGNPRWDCCTKAQSEILRNEANEYSEFENSGVIYRMIREGDWSKYFDYEMDAVWALDPRIL